MSHQKEKTDRSRQSTQAPPAVSVSSPAGEHRQTNHPCRTALTPKKILNGEEICSRFDQVSGRGLPKRMTTGKFVYLGPANRLPDSPF